MTGEGFMERARRHRSRPEDVGVFLEAVKTGDPNRVKRMLRAHPDLLFVVDDYYGSPVRAATDSPNPRVADYLAHVELGRLRDGSVPGEHLYGAIHDLGEAAHFDTGYAGCDSLRREAEPIIVGFLAHDDPQIRYIAISVLTVHWDLRQHAGVLTRMGLSDPAEEVRQIAVSGLGWLLRGTLDKDATHLLIGILRDCTVPEFIRETAYEALLEVWHGFKTAHKMFLRRLEAEELLRAAAGSAETDEERAQIEQQAGMVWQDFVDWDFVTRLEQGDA